MKQERNMHLNVKKEHNSTLSSSSGAQQQVLSDFENKVNNNQQSLKQEDDINIDDVSTDEQKTQKTVLDDSITIKEELIEYEGRLDDDHVLKLNFVGVNCKFELSDNEQIDDACSSSEVKKQTQKNKDMRCFMCNKMYTDNLTLKNHLIIAHDKNIKELICTICNRKFTLRTSLRRHMKLHFDIKNFECTICNERFMRSCYLKQHMKKHKAKVKFVQELDGISLSSTETRQQIFNDLEIKIHNQQMIKQELHIEEECSSSDQQNSQEDIEEDGINVEEKLNKCEDSANEELEFVDVKCEFISSDEEQNGGASSSNKIEKYPQKKKDIRCFMCNEVFLDKKVLKKHLTSHAKYIENLICIICNQKFTVINSLRRHMKSHFGIKNFECTMCDKKFVVSSSLKLHMKYHLGIKNYECTICKKKFTGRNNFKRHMKIHDSNKDKNVECKICHKKCPHIGILKLHMKLHSGNNS